MKTEEPVSQAEAAEACDAYADAIDMTPAQRKRLRRRIEREAKRETEGMKVARIIVSNILGLEHLEIEPGNLTTVSGENGSGKTSVLEAIKAVVGGGHDASLLRAGAEKGEIILILEDGVWITKRVTAEESSTVVTHPTLGKLSKGQTFIRKLVDALSVNPIEFLTAPAKKRVDILLEALPMQVAASDLGFVPVEVLRNKDLSRHALEVIAAIGDELYDQRTGVNRAAKEKRATAAQMKETLPVQPEGGDWQEVFDDTKRAIGELQTKTRRRIDEVKAEASAAENDAKVAAARYAGEIDAELERRIAALRSEADKGKAAVVEKRDAKIRATTKVRDGLLAEEQATYEPMMKQLNEQLGQARAMLAETAKAESTRSFIDGLTADVIRLEGESERFTVALDSLVELKTRLLADLPVQGLEIRNGEIFLDGIPFDRVNTSRRIRLAIEVAKLRAGDLPLVCVDGLEALDKQTFEEFREEAVTSGLQFVVSRVSDCELSVASESGPGPMVAVQ